jgi:hypothetical protein
LKLSGVLSQKTPLLESGSSQSSFGFLSRQGATDQGSTPEVFQALNLAKLPLSHDQIRPAVVAEEPKAAVCKVSSVPCKSTDVTVDSAYESCSLILRRWEKANRDSGIPSQQALALFASLEAEIASLEKTSTSSTNIISSPLDLETHLNRVSSSIKPLTSLEDQCEELGLAVRSLFFSAETSETSDYAVLELRGIISRSDEKITQAIIRAQSSELSDIRAADIDKVARVCSPSPFRPQTKTTSLSLADLLKPYQILRRPVVKLHCRKPTAWEILRILDSQRRQLGHIEKSMENRIV